MEKEHNSNTMMLVNFASKLFRDHMRYETEKAKLNDTYRMIIFSLARNDNLTQLEIAKQVHLSAPCVSLTLQKMEKEGLIERREDDIDRRQTRIVLTDEGRNYQKHIFELIQKVERELFCDLSKEEQEEANIVLRKMIKKLLLIGGDSHENF